MAPHSRDYEDDFVLTIDDDDAPLPQEDEDELVEDDELAPTQNALKRKRTETADAPSAKSKKQKKDKKDKKSKKGKKSVVEEDEDDVETEEPSRKKSQDDDGAMDSDFEFQVGDVDSGVIEDFDGWGLGGPTQQSGKPGDKKGVDIDDLIARRRARKGQPAVEKSTDDKTIDVDSDGELDGDDFEGLDQDIEDDKAIQLDGEDSEDELLASDGFGMGAAEVDEDDEEDEDEVAAEIDEEDDDDEADAASDDDSVASPVAHPDDIASDVSEDEEDADEQARRDAFFAPEPVADPTTGSKGKSAGTFQTMSLSRPILRGLASVGFSDPTPIQAKTIPVALLGKDVVGGAVTGSGKTAAFMIPILERLLYRPKKVPTSRVAILMPTRELAVQCFNVAKKLASFTDVTFCQLVGGFSLREQESVLRTRPDVIIATPGRFIDHMRNSASFTVDTLEILVLDEADRMLEDGFADELNEILTTIPKSRQTMLFSATMTSSVDNLIRVGLNRPMRLLVDAQRQTVGTLIQEFVRLRPGKEGKRLAYLVHLCTKLYTDRCIIFFRQKKEAHRVRVIFGLLGFKAGELHGSMTQEQRIASVEGFRSGAITHLLATDVASRGLDIKNVTTVINYEAPQSHEIYLHRVGRTARAGRSGRACTIAAEPDRKVVKAAVKAGKAQGAKIVSRTVEQGEIEAFENKLEEMEEEIEEILAEEKEERALGQVDMRLKKGENMMEHEQEIMSRPKRTWFETEADKKVAKQKGNEELNGPSASKMKKGGKLSNKDKKRLDDTRERKEGKMWKKGKGDASARPAAKPPASKPLIKGGKRPQKAKGKGKR